jgi:hypothetical protein
MKDWCQVTILLTLERVKVSANVNNINSILLKCMINMEDFQMRSLAQGGCAYVVTKILCSKDIAFG